MNRAGSIAWKAAAVAGAFVLGTVSARALVGCDAYHRRLDPEGTSSSVCRARVARVLGDREGARCVELLIRSGERRGESVEGTQDLTHLRGRGRIRAGENCLAVFISRDGETAVRVASREREGYLAGVAAAFVALLALAAGRKGLATAFSVAWALVLLVGLLLPMVVGGARAELWCVPVALAIAVPTLLGIGGPNRKSLGAIGGTLCGVAAGGLLSLALTRAMALTGLEVDFGAYEHTLENGLWFAPALWRVDFGGLLVAGMLLAGLGAVMDVSMAVASTVAEVRRASPQAGLRRLFGSGLAAGRDILGVMVLTLAMVYVGSRLVSFLAWFALGWGARGMQLANYEGLASELARMAAAAVGMACCVPAAAFLTALLHRRRAARPTTDEAELASEPSARPVGRWMAVRPAVAVLACLVLAGLADEWTLRTYLPSPDQPPGHTVARVVAYDEPVRDTTAQSAETIARASGPRDLGFVRTQVAVVQPYFGPQAGRLLAARTSVGPNPTETLPLRRGAAVHVAQVDDTPGAGVFKLEKTPLRYRWGLVALVLVAATLVVGAGRVGLRVLAVMVAAAALMFGALVPCLLAGHSPVAVTAAFCLVMLGAVFAISGSADRKALAAIGGCVAGLLVAAVLVTVSSWWLGFEGTESVAARVLGERAEAHYDFASLLTATLLIALLGLAMDTAVTVAAGVAQVCAAGRDVGRRAAAAAGLNISRDIVGTMVLTLVFAFVGLHLPVFLVPSAVAASPAELINGEAGAAEILHILIGGIALAVTGPATALVAAWLMAGASRAQQRPRRAAGWRHWRVAFAAVAAIAALCGAARWWTLRRDRLASAALPPLPDGLDEKLARARSALSDGETAEALWILWAAREHSREDPRVRTELAYAYAASHWLAQARRELEAAREAGADDARSHYVAGVLDFWDDRPGRALEHWRRVAQLDPARELARGLEQAVLPALPTTRAAFAAAARTALRNGTPAKALLILWAARDRFPDDPNVRAEVAYAYMMNRWSDEARREIEAAIDAGARDVGAHYVAGVVYWTLGQMKLAEENLRRAVQLSPNDPDARRALDLFLLQKSP